MFYRGLSDAHARGREIGDSQAGCWSTVESPDGWLNSSIRFAPFPAVLLSAFLQPSHKLSSLGTAWSSVALFSRGGINPAFNPVFVVVDRVQPAIAGCWILRVWRR